jgi:hypothetical protein
MKQLHNAVYDDAGLPAKHRLRLARFWHSWCRKRRALDDTLLAALRPIRHLPSIEDVPVHIVNHISDLADRDHSFSVSGVSIVPPISAHCQPAAPHVHGRGPKLPSRCSCLACALRSLECMWNGNSGAEEGLRLLEAFQAEDLTLHNHMVATLYLPSSMITTDVMVLAHTKYLDLLIFPCEFLYFCRMAADEERFGNIFMSLPLGISHLST